MFVHHIVYLFANGELKEFVGSGLSPASARQNSIYVAKAFVQSGGGEPFEMKRIFDRPALTAADRARVQCDIGASVYRAAGL